MNHAVQRVSVVARNTVRESLRNRVLYALLGSTGLVMLISTVLGWVTVEIADKSKVLIDFSLSAMTVFPSLAAIFLGTNLIYQEVEKRTIYTLLARPLSRGEFILGKYLGLVLVNAISLAAITLFFIGFLLVNGVSLHLGIFQAIYLIFLELALVTAMALLLSVTAHPIEGAVFATILVLAGHSTSYLNDLSRDILKRDAKDLSLGAQLLIYFVDGLYIVLPNLENFNRRSQAASGVPIRWLWLGLSTGYALVYGAILYFMTQWRFEKKIL